MVTLSEYVSNMSEDDKTIYYACGETIDKIDLLPQVESAKEKWVDILYLTDYLDEFVFKVMMNYKEKNFVNVASFYPFSPTGLWFTSDLRVAHKTGNTYLVYQQENFDC